MNDYSQIGISKIVLQARRNAAEIRCPRDGAFMRVRLIGMAPDPTAVDVECPACRRRADRVSLVEAGNDPGLTMPAMAPSAP